MKQQINEVKRMQQLAGVKKSLNENVNKTLEDGGFDPIEDDELLAKVTQVLSIIGGSPSAEAVNALTMVIEDAEGGNIDWN